MIRERKHRLALSSYEGLTRVSFTLCIQNRKSVFTRLGIIEHFTNVFADSIKKYSCINWVYLFMPDHFHFILEGVNENANVWKSVVLFKQKTGYWFSKNIPCVQWQKNFFDYVHRKEADLKQHISYILENPVRRKIIGSWKDYHYKGSLNFNLDEII